MINSACDCAVLYSVHGNYRLNNIKSMPFGNINVLVHMFNSSTGAASLDFHSTVKRWRYTLGACRRKIAPTKTVNPVYTIQPVVKPVERPRSPPPRQISPHRCNDKGVGPPKLKFYLDLTEMCNINAPSLPRFSRNLQNLYLISGCVGCSNLIGFAQGVMELWGF